MSTITCVLDVFELLHQTCKEIDEGTSANAEEMLKLFTAAIATARHRMKAEGLTHSDQESALFAVCSVVDEVILETTIEQKAKWQAAPLQKEFFDTTEAGVEFFDRLDALSAGSDHSNEVREVYLYCLKLGFTGKYFESGDRAHLDQLIDSNLKLLLKDTPVSLSLSPLTVGPEFSDNGSAVNRAIEVAILWAPAIAVAAAYFLLRSDLFSVISLVIQDK